MRSSEISTPKLQEKIDAAVGKLRSASLLACVQRVVASSAKFALAMFSSSACDADPGAGGGASSLRESGRVSGAR